MFFGFLVKSSGDEDVVINELDFLSSVTVLLQTFCGFISSRFILLDDKSITGKCNCDSSSCLLIEPEEDELSLISISFSVCFSNSSSSSSSICVLSIDSTLS